MATLTISVASISSEITADDSKATRVIQSALRQHGKDVDTMTGQQQADALISLMVDFIVNSATAQEAKEAAETARDGVLDSPPSWGL